MSKKAKILFVVLLLIVALALGYAVYYFTTKSMAGKIYDDLAQQVVLNTPKPVVESNDPQSQPSPEPEREKKPYVSPIDWDALWEINEDIYAWIELPGEWLSYPIVQDPNNSNYYIYRTIERENHLPGSIFTYPGAAKDFSQFNTVIYGHNMMDGSMFGYLRRFRSRTYLEEHPEFYIYTPEAKYTYTIFAVTSYDNRVITANYDEDWEPDREAFLDSIYNSIDADRIIVEDLEVGTQDHIVTLSTCVAGQKTKRLLVLGVLTDVEGGNP